MKALRECLPKVKKSIVSLLFSVSLISVADAQNVRINEFITDPKTDWNHNGYTNDTDNVIELKNYESHLVSLNGFRLDLIDSTPATNFFSDVSIPVLGYLSITNPPGDLNDNGLLRLVNSNNVVIHEVAYGNWQGSTQTNGNSHSYLDESLSNFPEGSTNWIKTIGTPGLPNSPPNCAISAAISGTEVRVSSKGPIYCEAILQKKSGNGSWQGILTNAPQVSLSFTDRLDKASSSFYRLVRP